MGRLRSVLVAAALGIAACGPGQTDPYSLLDHAWTAGWDRVQLQLGVTVDVQNQGGDVMPLPNNITVDPGAITAIVDTHTGQWRLTLAIPGNALGFPTLLGVGAQAVNAEILFDGTSLFAKSDLLPMLLQPGTGGPPLVDGDLTGWVRLGSTDELGPFLDPANPGAMLPIAAALPGLGAGLPLPSPGSPATLRQFFEDFGVVAEFKGTEARNGRDAHHVEAGLDIAKLARSDRLAALTGWGRDQLQGLTETARQVAVSSDWWFDKETGRVVEIELNLRTVQAPLTHVGATLLLSVPAMADPFTAPATFTEVPLKDLLGIGATGGGGSSTGGVVVEATPAPIAP
jgi:hypothetical protein